MLLHDVMKELLCYLGVEKSHTLTGVQLLLMGRLLPCGWTLPIVNECEALIVKHFKMATGQKSTSKKQNTQHCTSLTQSRAESHRRDLDESPLEQQNTVSQHSAYPIMYMEIDCIYIALF